MSDAWFVATIADRVYVIDVATGQAVLDVRNVHGTRADPNIIRMIVKLANDAHAQLGATDKPE